MPTNQVSIRVQTDGKAEVKNDFRDIGQAGVDAQTAIQRASDQTGAAVDRQMAKWKQMAAAAKDAEAIQGRQDSFNALLGVGGGSGKSAEEAAAVFASAANANAKLSTVQLQELAHSARGLFDTIAAGGSPTRALAMESGRLAQVLGTGPGGLGANMKAIGALALTWAAPAGVLALLAGGVALWAFHMHAAKAEAEQLQKAVDGLGQTQRAGMEAINHAIEFSEKYKVSNDNLFTSLEHVITNQGSMNDIVKRGIGVTDDMARAARDRAEAERLLTVEMLRQAAAEATKRAGAAKKDLRGFQTQADLKGAFVAFGLAGSADAIGAGQQAAADYMKTSGGDHMKDVIKSETDLASALNSQADALAKATLTVTVRNADAEAAARKAAEDAKKRAEEAKRQQAAQEKLQGIHDTVRLDIAKAGGKDSPEGAAAEYMARQQQLIDTLTKQYVEALVPAARARALAEQDVGRIMLAETQAAQVAIVKSSEGIKLTLAWQAELAKNPPIYNANADALADLGKVEEKVFDTMADSLSSGATSWKSFGDTVKGVVGDLVQEFEKLLVFNPIENWLFGGGGPFSVSGYQPKPTVTGVGNFITSLFGHLAGGTDNWPGGLSWVGEKGPELVNLPKGAQVFPSAKSMAMAGGHTFNVSIDARGADASAARNMELALRQFEARLPGIITSTVNDGISRRRIRLAG